MTNFGAHDLDIARWALGAKAPASVAAFGGRYELKDGGETPDVQEVIYNFPDATPRRRQGLRRELDRTRDRHERAASRSSSMARRARSLSAAAASRSHRKCGRPIRRTTRRRWQPCRSRAPRWTVAHVRNFLDCVKSAQRLRSPTSRRDIGRRRCVTSATSPRVSGGACAGMRTKRSASATPTPIAGFTTSIASHGNSEPPSFPADCGGAGTLAAIAS